MKNDFELYLCDPDKNTECRKNACFTNGGTCETTRNRNFAAVPLKMVRYHPVTIGDTVEFDKEVIDVD